MNYNIIFFFQKSNERYDTIESEPTEGQGDVSDVESETLTGQVFFQLFTCNLAFFSRVSYLKCISSVMLFQIYSLYFFYTHKNNQVCKQT